jgi:chemotaxis protein MotB
MKKEYTTSKISLIKKREAETWIYSYADLITNLLALFVMLLIITTGTQESRADFIRGIEDYVASKDYATGRIGTGRGEMDDFRQIIADIIQRSALSGQVSISATRKGIELSFESALVFESATANLSDEANLVLKEVAEVIQLLPSKYFIIVEGHTDSRPIRSRMFPSNWELSSARAGSVVRFFEAEGFSTKRMRAVGLASTEPLESDADSPRNRRVVIKIDEQKGWLK